MTEASFFQHAEALVDDPAAIGRGTRVWAWAHVMAGARVGEDCNIGEHCFVERGAILGDRVTVKNGVHVWDGVRAEDDVFLGPAAVLTNDKHPRSRAPDFEPVGTTLERGCSIGAGAVVVCGATVGAWALVGAGAVVTRDVPSHALVVGNPARLVGHVCRCARPLGWDELGAARCACGRRATRGADGVPRFDA